MITSVPDVSEKRAVCVLLHQFATMTKSVVSKADADICQQKAQLS